MGLLIVPNFEYRIEPFEAKNASDTEWNAYFELNHEIHWEVRDDKDDLPMPSELEMQFMMDPNPKFEQHRWAAWNADKSRMLGFINLRTATEADPGYDQNKHIGNTNLRVCQDARREGIASALMKTVVQSAAANEIRVIQGFVIHPSGRAFCESLGGTMAIESAMNRLKLDEVDWEMIENWAAEGPKRAEGVCIEKFIEVPEDDLEEYCKIYTETMNQQPMGEMEGEFITTPESRRLDEARNRGKNLDLITMITREPDGTISGLTEIFKIPAEVNRAHQFLTGVKDSYRGRGLGKWLKAEMLLYVRKTFPDVKMILTGNADENAPMLSINNRMGFKRYLPEAEYKFDVAKLRDRLGI